MLLASQTDEMIFCTERRALELAEEERRAIEKRDFLTPEDREKALKEGITFLREDAKPVYVSQSFRYLKEKSKWKDKDKPEYIPTRKFLWIYPISAFHQ